MKILTEPKNALIKQYKKLLNLDNVELVVEAEALREIAAKAIAQKTGARGLRSIMEGILVQPMFHIPTYTDISKVTITKECVTEQASPVLTDRQGNIVKAW